MARLVVIGAAALDRPVRVSGPVAGGARLHGRSLGAQLKGRLGGGGASAAVALAAAGHAALLASLVASDACGDTAITLARAAGVDITLVRRRPGPSATTLILVDPAGERTVIGLDADPGAVAEACLPDPQQLVGEPVAGLLVRSAYPGAEAWSRAARGPVVLHWPARSYRGLADVLVASADDLEPAFLADPFGAARALLGERLQWAVVTHGAAGATAHGATGSIAMPTPRVVVRDATGAGDVFAAGLLDALVAGAEMPVALGHACAWGAAAVQLESSAPVDAPPGTFRAF